MKFNIVASFVGLLGLANSMPTSWSWPNSTVPTSNVTLNGTHSGMRNVTVKIRLNFAALETFLRIKEVVDKGGDRADYLPIVEEDMARSKIPHETVQRTKENIKKGFLPAGYLEFLKGRNETREVGLVREAIREGVIPHSYFAYLQDLIARNGSEYDEFKHIDEVFHKNGTAYSLREHFHALEEAYPVIQNTTRLVRRY